MNEYRNRESGTGLDGLLEPSLEADAPALPLYSVRANFFVAFFGGVFAAAIMGLLNAKRMNRLRQDSWIPLVIVTAWTVVLVWAGRLIASGSAPDWMDFAGSPGATVRRLGSLVALLMFGLLYWKRKAFYRSQLLSGVDPPNPWAVGLGAVFASAAGTAAILFLAMAPGP